MANFDHPMRLKPQYYWDETAALKDDLPFYVKLVDAENRRHAMPGKCPSVFAFRVGYTMPFSYDSQHIFWHVIPADIELRENQLIFVPMPKQNELKKIQPRRPGPEEEKAQEEKKKPPKARPEPAEAQRQVKPEKGKPTYVVRYLPMPLDGKPRPPVELGVTFLTKYYNHRVVWDVMPTSEALASGVLFLDPYEDDTEELALTNEEKTYSRLKKLVGL